MKFYKTRARFFNLIAPFTILFILITFCGCPLRAKVILNDLDGADFILNTNVPTAFKGLLVELSSAQNRLNGIPKNNSSTDLGTILQVKSIQDELNKGIFTNAKVTTSTNDDFFVSAFARSVKDIPQDFIKMENQKQKKRLCLILSPTSFSSVLPSEDSYVQKYASILMAPLFSGEQMTQEEYTDLLSSVYGDAIAQELLSDNFEIEFFAPNKKNKKYKIPMVELLTLTDKRVLEFEY